MKKNLKDAEFSKVLCQTNSFGYRDSEIPLKKKDHAIRIIAMGDSVTFGHGVTAQDAYPNRLEEILNREVPARHFDVINTAVPGNCPFQEYYDFKNALIFKPDIAILQYDLNDVIEPYKVYKRYGAAGLDYHKVMDVPYFHHWLSIRSRFYLYLRYAYLKMKDRCTNKTDLNDITQKYNREINWKTAAYPSETAKEREAWQECLKWMQKHADLCHSQGIPCIVLVSPTEFQFYDEGKTYFQDMARDFAQREGLHFIDMLSLLKQDVRTRLAQKHNRGTEWTYKEWVSKYRPEVHEIWEEYFSDIDHYTPRGHVFVAQALQEVIEKILP